MSHSAVSALPTFRDAASRLADIGRRFYDRGWVMGTSGNFSAVVSRRPLKLAITSSAAHKGRLAPPQFLQIDAQGSVIGGVAGPAPTGGGKPPPKRGSTSDRRLPRRGRRLAHAFGLEHDTFRPSREGEGPGHRAVRDAQGPRRRGFARAPRVDSDRAERSGHDAARARVRQALSDYPTAHAFLLERHGLYTWGATLDEAERHVEILEFLLEVAGRSVGS